MMVPPAGTGVRGVITSMGLTAAPATPPDVMEVNVIPVITPVSKATDNPGSALVLIWKPPVTAVRAPPRVSPIRVIPKEEVPVATPPPVVRTIVVLVAVAVGVEVAVKPATVAAVMEETEPKK